MICPYCGAEADHGRRKCVECRSNDAKTLRWIAFGAGLLLTLVYFVAVAVPNHLRAKCYAIQAAAVETLRSLNTAAETYESKYHHGYPPGLSALGPPPVNRPPDARAAGLIDSMLAYGQKGGYIFTYTPGEMDADGRAKSYAIHADQDPMKTYPAGLSHYFTDQSGVIRQETERPASELSPPISR